MAGAMLPPSKSLEISFGPYMGDRVFVLMNVPLIAFGLSLSAKYKFDTFAGLFVLVPSLIVLTVLWFRNEDY